MNFQRILTYRFGLEPTSEEISQHCDAERYDRTIEWGLLFGYGYHEQADRLRNQITCHGIHPDRLEIDSLSKLKHLLVLEYRKRSPTWDISDQDLFLDLFRNTQGKIHHQLLVMDRSSLLGSSTSDSTLLLLLLAIRIGQQIDHHSLLLHALALEHHGVIEYLAKNYDLTDVPIPKWITIANDCLKCGSLISFAWIIHRSEEIRSMILGNSYLFPDGATLSMRAVLFQCEKDLSLEYLEEFLTRIGYSFTVAEWWMREPDHDDRTVVQWIAHLNLIECTSLIPLIWELEGVTWEMCRGFLIKEAFCPFREHLFAKFQSAPVPLDHKMISEIIDVLVQAWYGSEIIARVRWLLQNCSITEKMREEMIRKLIEMPNRNVHVLKLAKLLDCSPEHPRVIKANLDSAIPSDRKTNTRSDEITRNSNHVLGIRKGNELERYGLRDLIWSYRRCVENGVSEELDQLVGLDMTAETLFGSAAIEKAELAYWSTMDHPQSLLEAQLSIELFPRIAERITLDCLFQNNLDNPDILDFLAPIIRTEGYLLEPLQWNEESQKMISDPAICREIWYLAELFSDLFPPIDHGLSSICTIALFQEYLRVSNPTQEELTGFCELVLLDYLNDFGCYSKVTSLVHYLAQYYPVICIDLLGKGFSKGRRRSVVSAPIAISLELLSHTDQNIVDNRRRSEMAQIIFDLAIREKSLINAARGYQWCQIFATERNAPVLHPKIKWLEWHVLAWLQTTNIAMPPLTKMLSWLTTAVGAQSLAAGYDTAELYLGIISRHRGWNNAFQIVIDEEDEILLIAINTLLVSLDELGTLPLYHLFSEDRQTLLICCDEIESDLFDRISLAPQTRKKSAQSASW